jgi:hypothetical protein
MKDADKIKKLEGDVKELRRLVLALIRGHKIEPVAAIL